MSLICPADIGKYEMSMTIARSHKSMIKIVMDILCGDMNHKILNT